MCICKVETKKLKTFPIKQYFVTYADFSSSHKIGTFEKATYKLNLKVSFN